MRRALLIFLAILATVAAAGCGAPRHPSRTPHLRHGRPTVVVDTPHPIGRFVGRSVGRFGTVANPAVGDILVANPGTWTNAPTPPYGYQWQRCNSSGSSCSNISGATSQTYQITTSDQGYYLRVVVTAKNSHGSSSAHSALTGQVPGGSTQTTNCFSSPTACGYPDPSASYPTASYVGPTTGACSSLTPMSGTVTLSTSGQTYSGYNVTGHVVISAANVTMNNDCVTDNAAGVIGTAAITVSASGAHITNTVAGGANTTTQSVEAAVTETGAYSPTADHDYFYNCGECVHENGWTLTNSYVKSNATPYSGGYSGSTGSGSADHHEDVYCNSGAFTGTHDTLLDPFEETANVFCNTNNGSGGACANQISLTNSLLAGGGFTIYSCGNSSSAGTGTLTFTGNNLARCEGTPLTSQGSGGFTCGTTDDAGADTHGYWPYAGYFGVGGSFADTYCPPTSGVTWSGNEWDDTAATVACSQTGGSTGSAPTNSGVPVISGTTTQGHALSTTNGSWTNTPTGYSYQWQRCSGTCASISGATSSSYTLTSADVGDTIDVVVTATNASGSGSATSAATAAIAASGGQTTNCFSSPSACAYPAVSTVGSTTACSSLTTLTSSNVPSGWTLSGGELQPTGSGTSGSPITLSGYNFSASGDWLYIGSNSYITLTNDCFDAPGAGVSFASGYGTVTQTGGNHLTVNHVTVVPTGCSAAYNQICAAASADNTNISAGGNSSITNSLLGGAAESIHTGNSTTISGNYVNANGDVSGQHDENIYVTNTQGLTITGNTMYNPFNQTAEIFGDSSAACSNQWTVTGNLIAGGGYAIYWCGNASSNGSGTLTFQNNDLARCTTTPQGVTSGSTSYCGSTAPNSTADGQTYAVGTSLDSHGFWPNVGGFGVDASMLGCPSPAVQWSGNFYDDNGATVGC